MQIEHSAKWSQCKVNSVQSENNAKWTQSKVNTGAESWEQSEDSAKWTERKVSWEQSVVQVRAARVQ